MFIYQFITLIRQIEDYAEEQFSGSQKAEKWQ